MLTCPGILLDDGIRRGQQCEWHGASEDFALHFSLTVYHPTSTCRIGDVATIFGGRVSLDEQATRAGTISYELLTAMGPRIQRRYHP